MNADPVVIVSAARTPLGAFQGELKGFAAPELGAAAIRAAVESARIKPEDVQEALRVLAALAVQGSERDIRTFLNSFLPGAHLNVGAVAGTIGQAAPRPVIRPAAIVQPTAARPATAS